MNYRVLGKSNITVSEVGLSCWAIGGHKIVNGKLYGWSNNNDKESYMSLHRAFELGINYFDTAYSYGNGHSDKVIGDFVKDIERNNIIISSKLEVPNENFGYKINTILKNLNTDYLDILFLHVIENTYGEYFRSIMEQLNRLRMEGSVLSIGLCIESHNSLEKLYPIIQPEVIQFHFNPFSNNMKDKTFQFAENRNLGIVLYTKSSHALTPSLSEETNLNRIKSNKDLAENFNKLRKIKKLFGNNLDHLHLSALKAALSRSENCCVAAGFKGVSQVELNSKVSDISFDSNKLIKLREILT